MCRACAGLEIWAKKRVKKGEVAAAAHQPSADSLWADQIDLGPHLNQLEQQMLK